MTSAEGGMLVYVYAAVEGSLQEDALAALTPMPDGERLRAAALDSRTELVMSDVAQTTYNAAAIDERLRDLDWVSAAGASHHAVVDALAADHVVLPFRLFTLFATETAALETIARARTAIRAAFDRVRGRQEWVLRVARPDPARTAAENGGEKAAGGTAFLQAKARARRAEADRAGRVAQAVGDLFETLRPLATATSSRPVEAGEGVLLDAAFLIDAQRLDEFRASLQTAAAGLLRDGCPISFTGPWPPYSFASLDSASDA